jgi:hypothetical protein
MEERGRDKRLSEMNLCKEGEGIIRRNEDDRRKEIDIQERGRDKRQSEMQVWRKSEVIRKDGQIRRDRRKNIKTKK